MEKAYEIMTIIAQIIGSLFVLVPLIRTVISLLKDKTLSSDFSKAAAQYMKEAEVLYDDGGKKLNFVLEKLTVWCREKGLNRDERSIREYVEWMVDFSKFVNVGTDKG